MTRSAPWTASIAFALVSQIGCASAVSPSQTELESIEAALPPESRPEPEPEPKPEPEPEREREPDPALDVVVPDGVEATPLALKEVMAQAVYAPDPDVKELFQTKAAREIKKDGTNVTGFCVTPRGETSHVRTLQPFPDDPEVDRIIRDTLAKWRFKLFIVDGKPITVCSQRTFNIRFR